MAKDTTIKWHLKPVTVVVAILFAGPLALPLVWISPAFTKRLKIAITAVVAILTIWTVKVSIDLFNILLKELKELQSLM